MQFLILRVWTFLVLASFSPSLLAAQYSSQPVTINNPFLKDPAGFQLIIWGATHPTFASKKITTSRGGSVIDTMTASSAISNNGPLDFDNELLDKLASFSREKIPERTVHARGHGAFGHFVVTHDVSKWTMAKGFNGIGKVTRVLVRFSGTSGRNGASETLHDARGFALRLYTEDGNLDLVGNQIPVFQVRDPMIFPDFTIAFQPNAQTNTRDMNAVVDFLGQRPETINHFVRLQSDVLRAGSSRGINGSAINTYVCRNAEGDSFLCKFNWLTWQNIPTLSDEEIIALGYQEDYYTLDLYNAIERKQYPKWTLGMQVMTEDQAKIVPFDPLDPTKFWRYEDFPFHPIGTFVLDKNPDDVFTQLESAAFCPTFVPGVNLSRDRMLRARVFAYSDAQRYRLGPNFASIEVNRPLPPVNSYERDGAMRLSPLDNGEGGPVYFPNSFNGPKLDPTAAAPPGSPPVKGWVSRIDRKDDDNFSSVRHFLELDVGPEERQRIAGRLASVLSLATTKEIVGRALVNTIYPINRTFGDMVVRALQEIERQKKASQNATSTSYY